MEQNLASNEIHEWSVTDGNAGVISVDISRESFEDSVSDMSGSLAPALMNPQVTSENEEECTRLTLAYERLYEVPKAIVEKFSHHITYLDISHNKITNLDSLVYFKQLTSLIADDNPITETSFLPPLPKLQLLWLNRCKISSLYPWVGKLKDSCPNLEYLCLMGNPAAPSYFNGGTFYEYLQYRLFVISQFPSLNHLDDRSVTEDQRTEAMRLYKRPFFERLMKPGTSISNIVSKSVRWTDVHNKLESWWGQKDSQNSRQSNRVI